MTLVIREIGNSRYVYDYTKVAGKTKATYLGRVGNPQTDEKVKNLGKKRVEEVRQKYQKISGKGKI
ncbi:MAG: hypothetical protein FIB07_13895 [Candidatus Methanoperedens sp.]|nr:hypothetical protein [Candidatus Methanoperedens sp.]